MNKFLIGLVVLGMLVLGSSVHAYDEYWLTTHKISEIAVNTEMPDAEWLLMADDLYNPYRITLQHLLTTGLGTDADHMVLSAAGTRAVDIFTTYAGTGTNYAVHIAHVTTVAGASGGAMYVEMTPDARTGSFILASFHKLDLTDCVPIAGPFGQGTALMAEIIMPDETVSGGEYHALALEMSSGSSFVHHGNAAYPMSFIKMQVYGTEAIQEVEDHGYLFSLSGIADTAGGLFDATVVTPGDVDFTHSLKINIGGTDYFIGLNTVSTW